MTQDSPACTVSGPATTLNGRPKSAYPEVFRVDNEVFADYNRFASGHALEWRFSVSVSSFFRTLLFLIRMFGLVSPFRLGLMCRLNHGGDRSFE